MLNSSRWFFLVLWVFSCNSLLAQSVDQSLIALKEIKSWPAGEQLDSARSYHYNFLAEAYSGQYDSLAQLYIDSLATLNSASSWTKTEGLYYRAQGKYHDRRGEFDQALEMYSKSIESFKGTRDRSDLIAYTYILKAFVLNNNGLYEECERTLNEVRPLAEQLHNKNFLAWIIDWHGDKLFYSSFGKQDFNRALEYYKQVETILPQVRNNMVKADNAHGLAGCYIRLGDEEKALQYRDRALAIAKEHGLHSVIFAIYGDMADVYEGRGQWKEAIGHRLLALDYAKQTHWIEMEARALRTAAYTYKASGDFENALTYYEQLTAIEDSLNRFEVQTKYHELEAQYESDKKDFQIQRLKANNLAMWVYVLTALLLGGTLFLIYYLRTNRKLRHQNEALINKNLEIQMALLEGQNIERKRMAIELHDNINTKIAAAKWMLETINSPEKPEEERAMIDRLVEAMSDIYEDVRFISHNLVPKDLEIKSLDELIGQLVQNLNLNQRIAFNYSHSGQSVQLDKNLKLQSYSMVMELINNILKHSGCRRASIKVDMQPQSLVINVEDDGKGFDLSKVDSGVGLKNIRSRIESVNGAVQYTTSPGAGTSIRLTIPIKVRHVGAGLSLSDAAK